MTIEPEPIGQPAAASPRRKPSIALAVLLIVIGLRMMLGGFERDWDNTTFLLIIVGFGMTVVGIVLLIRALLKRRTPA